MLKSVKTALKYLRGRIVERHLSATARSVRLHCLTYLSAEKMERIERAVAEAIGRDIPGDFMEFGVAMGGSAIVVAERAVAAGRTFHGFDVFGMIPPPTSEKDDEKSKERWKVISSGKSRGIRGELYYGYRDDLFTEVCGSFARYGLPLAAGKVELHKGLFEATVPDVVDGRSIAFAHIDCDWYDPVKFCLDVIGDRMATGGVIVFDDYNDYGGCRTAVDEFIMARPDYELEVGPSAILRRL